MNSQNSGIRSFIVLALRSLAFSSAVLLAILSAVMMIGGLSGALGPLTIGASGLIVSLPGALAAALLTVSPQRAAAWLLMISAVLSFFAIGFLSLMQFEVSLPFILLAVQLAAGAQVLWVTRQSVDREIP